jgi:hypothetical protein
MPVNRYRSTEGKGPSASRFAFRGYRYDEFLVVYLRGLLCSRPTDEQYFLSNSESNTCLPSLADPSSAHAPLSQLVYTSPVVEALAERTLGYGTANAKRLNTPINESAILVWQGVLEDKSDIARVQLPIPDGMVEAGKETSAAYRSFRRCTR